MRNYRDRRIIQGLCPECGNPNNTDYYLCDDCREKRREYDKQYREKCRQENRCPKYGNVIDGKGVWCNDCLKKKRIREQKKRGLYE